MNEVCEPVFFGVAKSSFFFYIFTFPIINSPPPPPPKKIKIIINRRYGNDFEVNNGVKKANRGSYE